MSMAPELDYRYSMELVGPVKTAKRPDRIQLVVRIMNESKDLWRIDGDNPIRLGVQLRDLSNELIDKNFRRIDLPHQVKPGGAARINVTLALPDSPRDFILRLDVVHEMVHWFDDVPDVNQPIDLKITRVPTDAAKG